MADPWNVMESFRLDDRVAVVTGASSGLGVAFAKCLSAAGATVVLAARREDRLADLASEIEAHGGRALAVGCDVTSDAQVEALFERAHGELGRIDVLVNNAGISEPMPAEHEPMELFRKIVDINLTGQFCCAQQAGRRMLEAGSGVILNVASVLGFVASGQIPQASYTATKSAMVNLTRELATQWARKGVRVNGIAPGWFPSEMTEEMFTDDRATNWMQRRTPMGRGGEEHELCGALLFLASDASSYVTGQTVLVDGGWTIV